MRSLQLVALCVPLIGLGACVDETASGDCQSHIDCGEGNICEAGTCKRVCAYDTQCSSGQICENDVCVEGERAAVPVITAVDGDGSPDDRPEHTRHHFDRTLLVQGEHLAGAEVKLSGGDTTWTLEPCNRDPNQLVLAMPKGLSANPDTPTPYTLTVANQQGSCAVTLPVLQGERGPAGEPQTSVDGLDGGTIASDVTVDGGLTVNGSVQAEGLTRLHSTNASVEPGDVLELAHNLGTRDLATTLWVRRAGSDAPFRQAVPTARWGVKPYGDGSDGDLIVGTNESRAVNKVISPVTGETKRGDTRIAVQDASGFQADDEILIHNGRGSPQAGAYEFRRLEGVSGNTLQLNAPLGSNYPAEDAVFVYRVPNYANVTVESGAAIVALTWDAESGGGIVAFRVSGSLTVEGEISAAAAGYRGQDRGGDESDGVQGEGHLGPPGQQTAANGNGGGGGTSNFAGGGGGGHAGSGQPGAPGEDGDGNTTDTAGQGGGAVGSPTMNYAIFFGGAGGTGGDNDNDQAENPNGGHGGGIIYVAAAEMRLSSGVITADGQAGQLSVQQDGGAGGGAGGSIYLLGNDISLGTVTAAGGAGFDPPNDDGSGRGGPGGDGSEGRIRIEAANITGNTTPAYYTSGQSASGVPFDLSAFAVRAEDENTIAAQNVSSETMEMRLVAIGQ